MGYRHIRLLVGAALVLVFLFLLITARANSSGSGDSVYDVMESYKLPKGILPTNAKDYVLNSSDGSFEVFLEMDGHGACTFGIEAGYQLKYQRRISGKISPGSLMNLKGVSVKILFIWLDISEVELQVGDDDDDGQLDFYVGPFSAAFPLSNFDVSPTCGCGLDCITSPILAAE